MHGSEVETRGNLRTERGVEVSSKTLGISGKIDLLEIKTSPYALRPVEYKRGKPKIDDCDRIQLCAQVLCLEEMRNLAIPRAAIWYWQVRKREWIDINKSLRKRTLKLIEETRTLLESRQIPKAHYTTSCKACSFFDHCKPKQTDRSLDYVKALFET